MENRRPLGSWTSPEKMLNASNWLRYSFIWMRNMLMSDPPFDPGKDNGFDKMALLSWILRKVSSRDQLSYALHYWDVRVDNMFIDENQKLV
jgi:hypothetical protein